MSIPWSEIETILLDMDGTLLDLHFDNYFWLEYLPRCYSNIYQVSYEYASELLTQEYKKIEGTLDWYCVDYWAKTLNLPIMELKQDIADRIQWRKNAELFLARLNAMEKNVVLITNAHPASLALKNSKLNLAPWFKTMLSSHEYGCPKEDRFFWKCLQRQINFNPDKTLFIDDSLTILNSAKAYQIKHIYTVLTPDSKRKPQRVCHDFNVIYDFADCFV